MNKRFLPFVLISYLVICLTSCSNTPKDESIVVKLVQDESFSILSDNPLRINRNENASFAVDILNDYIFDDSSEGRYDSKLKIYTVENVETSRNVYLKTLPKSPFKVNVINDSNCGEVSISPRKRFYDLNEEIEIEVKAKGSYEYMCTTKTHPFRTNDESASGKPVSFVKKFKYTVKGNSDLYINYFTPGLLKMEYDANGGSTIDGEDIIIYDYSLPSQFRFPTTMLGTHYLYRDGYTLESYNTKADGTGTRVGIGSSVDISFALNNSIKLYAQWEKWSESSVFKFVENEKDVEINGFLGDSDLEKIVIPNMINNKPVKTIKEDSFVNLLTDTIIFNQDLVTLEQNALKNCNQLQSIVLFTNIRNIYSNSITSCSLSTIKINQTLYAFDNAGREMDMTAQIQNLEVHSNKVIFFGLSTMRFNHPVSYFKQKWPDKYFYIAGMQGGTNYRLALELVEQTMNPSETMFFSVYETGLDPHTGTALTFAYLKYNLDLIQRIDYRDYKYVIFPQLALYCSSYQDNQSNDIYLPQYFEGYDNDGMVYSPSEDVGDDNYNPSYEPILKPYEKVENLEWIMDLNTEYSVNQDHFRLTWSSYNINSVPNINDFLEYESFVTSNVEYLAVDNIEDNILSGSEFRKWDSIHLSPKGGEKRMKRWADIIESKGWL